MYHTLLAKAVTILPRFKGREHRLYLLLGGMSECVAKFQNRQLTYTKHCDALNIMLRNEDLS